MPDTVIKASSYLIIWADKDESQAGLHADFKLSSAGESVYLVNNSFEIVNYAQFGKQTADVAFARIPNGTGNFMEQRPTFSQNNEDLTFTNIIEINDQIKAYPNPVESSLTIEISNTKSEHYSIINIFGQIVDQGVIRNSTHIIDASHFTNGSYLLKIGQNHLKLMKH